MRGRSLVNLPALGSVLALLLAAAPLSAQNDAPVRLSDPLLARILPVLKLEARTASARSEGLRLLEDTVTTVEKERDSVATGKVSPWEFVHARVPDLHLPPQARYDSACTREQVKAGPGWSLVYTLGNELPPEGLRAWRRFFTLLAKPESARTQAEIFELVGLSDLGRVPDPAVTAAGRYLEAHGYSATYAGIAARTRARGENPAGWTPAAPELEGVSISQGRGIAISANRTIPGCRDLPTGGALLVSYTVSRAASVLARVRDAHEDEHARLLRASGLDSATWGEAFASLGRAQRYVQHPDEWRYAEANAKAIGGRIMEEYKADVENVPWYARHAAELDPLLDAIANGDKPTPVKSQKLTCRSVGLGRQECH